MNVYDVVVYLLFFAHVMQTFWSKLFSILMNEFEKYLKNRPQNKSSKTGQTQKKEGQYSQDDFAVAVDTNRSDIGFAQDKISRISAKGTDLICGFEGLNLQAYDDGVGVCTIGFGTTVYPNGIQVKFGDQCTLEQAKSFMQHDLKRFEVAVSSAVKVPLNQNQFDALVSLTYNIGAGAFRNSTLLKFLNVSDYAGASQQFDVWIKAGGQTVQGLVNRRAIEKAYFLRN